ncbi:hypothetical protein L1887_23822 [Cichorium endivia]|nr:hypothetical protein L1887_23822 [Cichorium endivia]
MDDRHIVMLIVALSSSFALFVTLAMICIFRRKWCSKDESWDKESKFEVKEMEMKGELIKFEEDKNDIVEVGVGLRPGGAVGELSLAKLCHDGDGEGEGERRGVVAMSLARSLAEISA